MTGHLSLGIDVGTSGVRTAVIDAGGRVLSTVKTTHLPQKPNDIDASKWWTTVQDCITAQGKALKDAGYSLLEVSRIGVDGTSGTMVLTDDTLHPVTPALMYNSAGFTAEAADIAKHAPATHITKGSNSALARALRLQTFDADSQATHLLHQADFIIAHLRGQGGVSDENNTLKLGYDPDTGTWPHWFAQTGLRTDLLPKVVPAGTALGPIAPDVATALGLLPQTVIHAGTTDSIAAFLATASLEAGNAVTSLGTTLAIKILSPTRIDEPHMGLYSHKLGDVWLVGGASNTGGGVLASLFDAETLTTLSDQIDPSQASPLNYYPLLKKGERFPVNDPDLAPRMTPRPDNDAAFLHGLLEGVARIERQAYDAIAARGGPRPTRLYTAGGGAQNPVWTAIRARVLGITPAHSDQTEACIGIARLINSD
ncbi:FGGY-family carbohydrate kinase [Roseobacter sp. CCS2]|uniref:FGGY-family carbohydrate kinase n=1 Tax=Roseobacter sp. CCS2 TaxID=391593 RepID=UPI0000F401A2|nr:FGGY-family carbohydrate kinase [Roseobacter sp. CCS2]EBA13996.1 carbohydrate kinase, FGGY [Roseobacter sp. CCS2]